MAELIPDLLGNNYGNIVGKYLDARMITPIWSKRYRIGRLKLPDSGFNQCTTSKWPAKTSTLDDKLFDPILPEIPIQLQILDVPNLHTFS
jgi:hypothetical protein